MELTRLPYALRWVAGQVMLLMVPVVGGHGVGVAGMLLVADHGYFVQWGFAVSLVVFVGGFFMGPKERLVGLLTSLAFCITGIALFMLLV